MWKSLGAIAAIPINVFTKGAGPIVKSTSDSVEDLIYGNSISSEESLLRMIDQIINIAGAKGIRENVTKEEIYNTF